ncbi:hypothetical protein H4J02_07940 [Protaetiibacter sp. SSC-01]|uniref:lysoplasmalogenase family protein n=1 Tax=Protaetiibacter sp. SSC-01 TaxID=2759943 RepID=UPI0016572373|nr:lysoplasmalogenase family protein [Protaetiibacter sp. SSC-01]QNO36463.1 hypothetical protein H4J02_07940 [Protaetiibacter sp. SSC-01]
MPRVPLLLGAFAPFFAVSGFHLAVKLAGLVELDRATKGLTIPALLLGTLAVLWFGRLALRPPVLALLVAGLGLSWLGDLTLAFFELGVVLFLATQLVYAALFHVAFLRRPSWWAIGLVPWYAGLLLALWPYLGDQVAIVAVYGAALAYMAAAATRGNSLTTIGGALFVGSGSLIAFRMFTPLFQTPGEDALIMGLYLAAQFCVVAGVLRTAVRRAPRRRDAARPA